jgi:hypothetical protein
VHNEDTKKVCTFHTSFMPGYIQEAIKEALKGGTVVTNV